MYVLFLRKSETKCQAQIDKMLWCLGIETRTWAIDIIVVFKELSSIIFVLISIYIKLTFVQLIEARFERYSVGSITEREPF